MLKLKLQYFGHLMRRNDSLKKTLILGKIEGKRRRGRQKMRWFDAITYSMGRSLSKHWEIVKDMDAWHAGVHGVSKSQTRLTNWTTAFFFFIYILLKYIWHSMFQVHSKLTQLYVYTYVIFQVFFFIIAYEKTKDIVPSAIQWIFFTCCISIF